jgi:hypothetical protein
MSQSDIDPKLARIEKKLDSLIRHVESLDRSMQKLAGRIIPFPDEDMGKILPRHFNHDPLPMPATLNIIYAKLVAADKHIQNIELDFSKVRSEADTTELGAVSREDFKPHKR